MTKEEL